jgi:hypothetical protein
MQTRGGWGLSENPIKINVDVEMPKTGPLYPDFHGGILAGDRNSLMEG